MQSTRSRWLVMLWVGMATMVAGVPCAAGETLGPGSQGDGRADESGQVQLLRAQLEAIQQSESRLVTIVGAGFAIPVAILVLIAGYNWFVLPRRYRRDMETMKTELSEKARKRFDALRDDLQSMVNATVSASLASTLSHVKRLECRTDMHIGLGHLRSTHDPVLLAVSRARQPIVDALKLSIDLDDDWLAGEAADAVKLLVEKALQICKMPNTWLGGREPLLPSHREDIRTLLGQTSVTWNEERKLEVLKLLKEIDQLAAKQSGS